MTGTMRAFVIKKVGETGVVEKPIPEPGPEEAIVKTTASLICTSDVHTVKGALPVPDGRTLGHESVGVIHRLGSAVTGFEEGQRVAVCAVTPCYRCSYCQRGFTSQCGGPLGAFGLGMNDKAIHTGLCPGGNERMNRLFRLMLTGRIDPTPMTTHTFGFDDVSRAFAMMTTKDDGIIKPLITFA